MENTATHFLSAELHFKKAGICKLCRVSGRLKRSHVIPRLAVKLIRDKELNNRFYELTSKRSQIVQDCPKEYLLCNKCEQLLGNNYEKYFKEAIHRNKHNTQKTHDGSRLIIENLDYKKMKLFFLSLLWKASISSVPEFEHVRIGENEELLRQMVLTEAPGKSVDFSVIATVPLLNNTNNEGWSTNFIVHSTTPAIYSILIGGIFYSICATTQNTSFPAGYILNESGRWLMPLVDVSHIKCLWDFIINRAPD